MLFFLTLQAAAKFSAFFYLCCCFHLPGSFLKQQLNLKKPNSDHAQKEGPGLRGHVGASYWEGEVKEALRRPRRPHSPGRLSARVPGGKASVTMSPVQVSREVWKAVSWGLEASPLLCTLSSDRAFCCWWCGPVALKLDVIRVVLKNAMLSPACGVHQ